jgi:hypothetical protein
VSVEFYFGEQSIGIVSAAPRACGCCGHPSLVFVNRDGRTGCLDCAGVAKHPYCFTCQEWLGLAPLNGDPVLLSIFHGSGLHDVRLREVEP